jgi:hypothetical protein
VLSSERLSAGRTQSKYRLELECGHVETRNFALCVPSRVICSTCPCAGGNNLGKPCPADLGRILASAPR